MNKRYGIHSTARGSDRMRALLRSHQLVSSGNWLVLDTETTGLGAFDQVIEVSLCDPELQVSTWRIQPTVPIQEEATLLHGMTEADLAYAPTYAEIWPVIEEHIARRVTVMYNAEFDYNRLARSARAHQMKTPSIDHRWCVMAWFAQFYGQKSGQGGYRYTSLKEACVHVGIPVQDANLHSSAYDARLTTSLLQWMAEEWRRRSNS